jgi:penicillin-binding protein 2
MAPRGNFYDRNGVPLVTNRPGFTLVVNAKEAAFTPEVARALSEITGVPSAEIIQKVEKNKDNFEPVLIKSDLTQQMMTKIEERGRDLPGAMIVVQPLRTYLFGEVASHIIGYVGEVSAEEMAGKNYRSGSIVGKMGLEQYYDSLLRGQDGARRVEVDVAGRVVQEIGTKEPVPGHNIYLTLDIEMQKAAEKAVDEQLLWLREYGGAPNAYAASVVVMDPRDGAILAMVSRPAFNPNIFVGGLTQKDWDALSKNPYTPLNNKAISGEYPPGSTFKIVTGTAALELGKVTPQEKILDRGYHWAVPDKGNAGGEVLGWLNFREALSMSDNVYFFEMGYRLGIEAIAKYAREFGYGNLTKVNLFGESEGVVASPEYKKRLLDEDWYLAETFDAAIGQGFQLATPIQMANAVAAVANGGVRFRPRLVERAVSDKGVLVESMNPEVLGRIPMSESNGRIIREALREVAQEGGTASQLAWFPIPLAGKTGTSENSQGRDHGIFVSYAPADNPTIAMAVLVEHGGFGSTACIPIARRIYEQYFHIKP